MMFSWKTERFGVVAALCFVMRDVDRPASTHNISSGELRKEKTTDVSYICNLKNVFYNLKLNYLWCLSKVAQRKCLPICHVFPPASRGGGRKLLSCFVVVYKIFTLVRRRVNVK